MLTVKEAAEFLRLHNNFELLTHDYPDGDTLGSAYALCLALRSLGKNARIITTGLPKNFGFLNEGVEEQSFDAETIVSVDVADEKLLGCKADKYRGRIDLCIDHHATNRVEAKNTIIDGSAAANCEIIYHIIQELGVEITRPIANAIYTGISTDTGCFKYSNTTPQTLRLAADIIEIGCDSAYINKLMFDTKSKAKLRLEKEIYENITYCADGRCAIIYTTLDMQAKLGVSSDELEGLASIPRQIEGVSVGITMREKEGGIFKVSVRTNSEVINAADFCAKFGGGGHREASGCTIKGSLEEARQTLIAAVEEAI